MPSRRVCRNKSEKPEDCKIFFLAKPMLGDTDAMAQQRAEALYANAPIEARLAALSTLLQIDLSQPTRSICSSVESAARPASIGALAYSASARCVAIASVSPSIGLARKKILQSSGFPPVLPHTRLEGIVELLQCRRPSRDRQ